MNGCDDCAHAIWQMTKNGRLHPNKQGRCAFVWVAPAWPKAFHFLYTPKPNGGYIERGDPRCDDCPCFIQKRTTT